MECKCCKENLKGKAFYNTPVGVYCPTCWEKLEKRIPKSQKSQMIDLAMARKFARDMTKGLKD